MYTSLRIFFDTVHVCVCVYICNLASEDTFMNTHICMHMECFYTPSAQWKYWTSAIPWGKDLLSTQTTRCSFCSFCERGEASLFRRSAPSCWHCSLVACSSGQSLIITGSASMRVGFVRKQLSVLRGQRQKERADKEEHTLWSIRCGTEGPVGWGIIAFCAWVCVWVCF